MLPQFSCTDLVAVLINYNEGNEIWQLVVCSVFFLHYDAENPLPSRECDELMHYCDEETLY
jgi:hypothetical protein